MVFNVSGLLAVVEVAFRPHLLVPKLVVEDIRALRLQTLKSRGVVGVVLDKDNCLTKPKHDALVPELREAWPHLIRTFGRENVLIVSNSAGTRDDAGFLQAESVSRHLSVPVLLHATKKPGCGRVVQDYFNERMNTEHTDRKGKDKAITLDQVALDIATASTFSIETPEAPQSSISASAPTYPNASPLILVIGDRVMTDVVLANRMNKKRWRQTSTTRLQALPVLTTRLWQKEGLGTRLMRTMETFAMRRASAYYSRKGVDLDQSWRDCIIEPEVPQVPVAIRSYPSTTTRMQRPVYQYFSKEHVKSILSRVTYGMMRILGRLLSPLVRRIHPILMEARQAQFGFRIPHSYQRTKALREILEGRRTITNDRK